MKRRPLDHPVIVHIAAGAPLDDYARDVPDVARTLAAAFWPGPLTLVLRKRPDVIADAATGGRPTVGLRVPDHPVALALLARVRRRHRRAVGQPVRTREPDDGGARARRPRCRRRFRARRWARAASVWSRRSSTSRPRTLPILRVGGDRRARPRSGSSVATSRAATPVRSRRRAPCPRTTRPTPASRSSRRSTSTIAP